MSLADCPSNLKEAIDWILRVTGKDGGGGTDGTDALAKAVKGLLEDAISELTLVIGNGHVHGSVLQKLKEGLEKAVKWVEKDVEGGLFGNSPGPIGRLSDGLAGFIGYENISGSFFGTDDWKITGTGIAPSNIATYRLCDATIAFTIGVLEKVREAKMTISVNITSQNKEDINNVVSKLHACYGKGPKGLKDVSGEVKEKLDKNSFVRPSLGFRGFLEPMVQGFETLATQIDGQSQNPEKVAEEIGEYLKKVFGNGTTWGSASANDAGNQLKTLAKKFSSGNKHYTPFKDQGGFHNEISKLSTYIKTDRTSPDYLKPVLESGKYAFMDTLKKRNYESYYKGVTNDPINPSTHAKIFLGCLPLYYQALTYIYWGCHDNGGGWRNQTLAGGAMRFYFDSQGLLPLYVDKSKTGAHIADSALNKFSEFATAATSLSAANSPYVKFTKELQKNVTTNGNQLSTKCPLSAVFYGASCYFQCQQITNAKHAVRAPKTIREMLYFLAALQFSPKYDSLQSHISGVFRTLLGKPSVMDDAQLSLPVADSGTSATGNTLSAADLKSHLLSTFIFIPGALGVMQGPGASEKSEPWLYELFCNSAFQLKYSSGAALFSAISNYAYALQFQLTFLFHQCSIDMNKCGWNNCTYGSEIKGSDTQLSSHICPGLKCGGNSNCNHSNGNNQCKHNKYTDPTSSCGRGSNPSALQAFLTDGIQGMCRQHPGSSYHLSTCAGPMCHVPMGFKAERLRQNPRTGNLISLTLQSFCGTSSSPLRQLSEKLGCLTKRTPRSLGDMFGFIWHLNGQLFNKDNIVEQLKKAITPNPNSVDDFINKLKSSLKQIFPQLSPEQNGIIKSLQTMAPVIPFLYQLFRVNTDDFLPVTLFNLAQHCHKMEVQSNRGFRLVHKNPSNSVVTSGHDCSSSPNDLWSLYQPITDHNNRHKECASRNCGGYFYPLSHSEGSTFAPKHASTYLSWVLYLAEDLQSWFQEMLNEFKNIDCTKTGCKSCNQNHGSGSSTCSCTSIVHCGGVLPLLYRYGFTFSGPFSLSGAIGDQSKRSCDKFHTQLTAVLSTEAPLTKLLTTIDEFLYMFRFYFVYNLFTLWIMYVCIVLYIYFLRVDLLHIRSHMHLPTSHRVPPIGLLTTGKAPALMNLTYYMP
ncbi:variant erythrocyte surface antigen-1 family protein [Babesia caballi]|uniref:Variant erythrocyte surface antigen-1 family protein n=1 Tax=Babesia caballi TaxID=5871 RepID=A0AAV4LX76_BABCB|nr:variant erythrocyte surface antigen-1 family protein [Babesia caballi]